MTRFVSARQGQSHFFLKEPPTHFNLTRAKLRYSISLKEYSNWKLDITLVVVKSGTPTLSELTSIRNNLFPKDLTIDNFVEKAPWTYAQSIEFELEAVDFTKITEHNLAEVIKHIESVLDIKDHMPDNKDHSSHHLNSKNAVDTLELLNNNLDLSHHLGSPNHLESQTSDPHDISEEDVKKLLSNTYYDIHGYQSKRPINFKGLTNNVIELTKLKFVELAPNIGEFYMTDKADGIRNIVVAYPTQGYAYVISGLEIYKMDIQKSSIKKCIFDAEFINDSFLIFDVMFYETNLSDKDFENRKSYIPKILELSPKFLPKTFLDCDLHIYSNQDPTHSNKDPTHKSSTSNNKSLEDLMDVLEKNKHFSYETDGIIFTKKTGTYVETENYKWKPIEKMTIDFLVRKCPHKLLGVHPYVKKTNKTLYFLFVGINFGAFSKMGLQYVNYYRDLFSTNEKLKYFPIQFSPSSFPLAYMYWSDQSDLDKKIVELHYNISTMDWELVQIRTDKAEDAKRGLAFGNDFRIAEYTWENYFNPLTKSDLTSLSSKLETSTLANNLSDSLLGFLPTSSIKTTTKIDTIKSQNKVVYFQEHNNVLYKELRNYNSFIKEQVIQKYANTDWCIDLASGKGQDLFRYIRSHYHNVLFIENDKLALAELLNRKYSFVNSHDAKFQKNKMQIYTLQADLTHPADNIYQNISKNHIPLPSNGASLIICNLAIHYLIGGTDNLKNFCKLVNSLLKSGGRFSFTTFNSKKVQALLDTHNNNWNIHDNDILKYSIKKISPLHGTPRIEVLLPFSDGEYYPEFMVNIDTVSAEFKKYKINLEVSVSFEEYKDKYSGKLSDIDMQFASLYQVYIFYKI